MAKLRTGRDCPIAKAIYEMAGAPKHTRSITVVCRYDDVTRVTIEYMPEMEDDAPSVFRGYQLVPIEEGDG